jgi:hypothetical protein
MIFFRGIMNAVQLDTRLRRGARLPDGHTIIALIPHASLDHTWAVTGERGGQYATWFVYVGVPGGQPYVYAGLYEIPSLVLALADMLRRARQGPAVG